MSLRQKLSAWIIVGTMSALLAVSWITLALAQSAGDGDGLDGDELGLPILLGVAVLGYVGWTIFRGRSRKSS